MTTQTRPSALLALLAALLFAGTAEAASLRQDPTPSRPMVRGVLLDELTRAPVASAEIRLLRTNGNTISTVLTDSLGQFAIAVPSPGTYRVRAEHLGYRARESGNLNVKAGEPVTIEFEVTPTPVMLDEILATGRSERRLRRTEQLLQGRLLEDETRQPIPQGSVHLVDATGKSVTSFITNEQGLFRLISPIPGSYQLRAERMGYQTAESKAIHLMLGDTIRLDFHLSVSAVALEPITVMASARPWASRYEQLGMVDFYNRMSRMSERGEFLTRDSIEVFERRNYSTSYMMRENLMSVAEAFNGNIRLNMRAGALGNLCNPRYLVNGGDYHLMGGRIDDAFPPQSIEAMEIYTAPNIPGEYGTGFPCGVIVIWTRRSR